MSNYYIDSHVCMPEVMKKLCLSSYPEMKEMIDNLNSSHPDKPVYKGCISVSSAEEVQESTKLLEEFDDVHTVYGIHPLYCNTAKENSYDRIEELIKSKKCVALGEIGLDFHEFKDEDFADRPTQIESFKKQMDIVKRYNKAIVLHTREAEEETKQMMKEGIDKYAYIDVHCYTSSIDFANWVLYEFPNSYIGIAGVVTFKNSKEIKEVVKQLPLDKILLETDGPYMAPVPFRGKPCHSGHIPYITKTIAEVKGIDTSRVYTQIYNNTISMFSLN